MFGKITRRNAFVGGIAKSDSHITMYPAPGAGNTPAIDIHSTRGSKHSKTFTLTADWLDNIRAGCLKEFEAAADLRAVLPSDAEVLDITAHGNAQLSETMARDDDRFLFDVVAAAKIAVSRLSGPPRNYRYENMAVGERVLIVNLGNARAPVMMVVERTEKRKWSLVDVIPMLELMFSSPIFADVFANLQKTRVPGDIREMDEILRQRLLQEPRRDAAFKEGVRDLQSRLKSGPDRSDGRSGPHDDHAQ